MRAALIALGAVVMGYAILGAATDPGLKPGGVVLFLAAVLVGHDAVLLPVTIAVGALLGRFVPSWTRPSIRAAAIVSLAVGVVALPLVLGYGRSADNPSVLPLAYGRGLTFFLVAVWAAALISAVVARRHLPGRRNREPAPTQTAWKRSQDHPERPPTGGLPTGAPAAGEARAGLSPAAGLPGNVLPASGPPGRTRATRPSASGPSVRTQASEPPVGGLLGGAPTEEPPASEPREGRP